MPDGKIVQTDAPQEAWGEIVDTYMASKGQSAPVVNEDRETAKEFLWDQAKQTAKDAVLSGASALTLDTADDVLGAIEAVGGKLSGSDRPFSELYDEGAEMIRGPVREARERSPISSMVAELAVPFGITSKAKGIKGVATSGAIGAGIGAAQTEDLEDLPRNIGTGAAFMSGLDLGGRVIKSGGSALVGDALKNELTALGVSPKQLRDRFGKSASTVKKKAEESLRNLRSRGFFSNRQSEYNPISGKFVPVKGGTREALAPSVETLNERLDRAIISDSAEVDKLLKKRSDEYVDMFGEGVQSTTPITEKRFKSDGVGMAKDSDRVVSPSQDISMFNPKSITRGDFHVMGSGKDLRVVNQDILDNYLTRDKSFVIQELGRLEDDLFHGSQQITISRLNEYKRQLYKRLETVFKDPQDPNTALAKQVALDYVHYIKDYINKHAPEVKKYNDRMADTFLFKEGAYESYLRNISDAQDIYIPKAYNPLNRGIEIFEGAFDNRNLERAAMGRALENPNSPLSKGVRGVSHAADRATFPLLRSLMGKEDNMSRKPQSVEDIVYRAKLPRTGEAILQQQDLALEKILHQYPESYDQVYAVLQSGDEQQVSDFFQALSRSKPELFQHDKYDRWNGVVHPEQKSRVVEDIMQDPSMTTVEKIQKRHILNTTGRVE